MDCLIKIYLRFKSVKYAILDKEILEGDETMGILKYVLHLWQNSSSRQIIFVMEKKFWYAKSGVPDPDMNVAEKEVIERAKKQISTK